MKSEIKKLSRVNKELEDKCQVEFVPKLTLPQNQRPFGEGVLGYKVHGAKDHPECHWMAIEPPNLIEEVRRLQTVRIVQMFH